MMYEYEIETLSPVHVGTGATINPIEYVVKGNTFYRVDMDKLFRDKEFDNEKFIKQITNKERVVMQEFNKPVALRNERYRVKISPNTRERLLNRKSEVHEHIKMSNTPYLPGTSLKGALRTAMMTQMIKKGENIRRDVEEGINKMLKDQKRRKKYADEEVTKSVFGKDPAHDLLKSVQISDTTGSTTNSLRIGRAKVLTTTNPTAHDWKPWTVFLEVFDVGTAFRGTIKIDDWLLRGEYDSGGSVPKELEFVGKQTFVENFVDLCKTHAFHIIDSEIGFYQKYNTPQHLGEIIAYYQKLKKIRNELEENESLLNLAWGVGWHGMTIAPYLRENFRILQSIRKKFKLGFRRKKPMVPEYPKTRRLVFENGKPKYPFGWVKLKLKEVD